ncbi:hypothetical protein GCM10010340_18400 [Streptomyces griseoloalbus]|nr:hypothetical protein GCM10010340_18400 [Streptomyces albaduncus]
MRAPGDPGPPSAVPDSPVPAGEPRLAPEAAAQALFGALTAVAATAGTGKGRTVHRTSSKELVKVPGHRGPERLRPRRASRCRHLCHAQQWHNSCAVTHSNSPEVPGTLTEYQGS